MALAGKEEAYQASQKIPGWEQAYKDSRRMVNITSESVSSIDQQPLASQHHDLHNQLINLLDENKHLREQILLLQARQRILQDERDELAKKFAPGIGNGDARFHDLLKELAELHARKAVDYGDGNEPLANLRASAGWGIPPWLGALVRAGDKMQRLQTYAKVRILTNESVEDSMMDLAAYALLALILLRESRASDSSTTISSVNPH